MTPLDSNSGTGLNEYLLVIMTLQARFTLPLPEAVCNIGDSAAYSNESEYP